MAETLTPKSIPIHNQKPPLAAPTSPFFLGSNDDQLERAATRAARAAAFRRKTVEVPHFRDSLSSDSCLDRHQIMELFNNCVKLATENKINQKNTWELKLIDHLSEIIKVEAEDNNAETNFQKASCSLETGVKIYAMRVDAWHADAYRVLNGISRAGVEDEKECSIGRDGASKERDGSRLVKETERKVSPLSTVESSFEVLNVKKFDVAFAVDPLYYHTSAQFDEGGAKGLLLYNLGVYGGCKVLFDSQEVPAKCVSPNNARIGSDLVDLTFAKECIKPMVMNLNTKKDICPTLSAIVEQLDGYSAQRQYQSSQDFVCDAHANEDITGDINGGPEFVSVHNADNDKGCGLDDGSYDNAEGWSFDHNDDAYQADDNSNANNPDMEIQYEEQDTFMSSETDSYDRFDNIASLLLGVSGITSSQNAWAGPDHWKYRKSKSTESVTAPHNELVSAVKKQKTKKTSEADINFVKALDEGMPDIFAPPKNPKSLLLPAKKVPCSNKLPEDCHYHPEDLVKLFLLPDVLCLGKKNRRRAGNASCQEGSGFSEAYPAWDNGGPYSGPDDDGYAQSDIEEQDILVTQPRQVNKIEVQYDKAAKQVDVHVLKETLWDHINGFVEAPEMEVQEDAISFKQLLASFPDDCGAAAVHDISPHLCFICLLHLANEHGLTIQGCTDMDDLSIHLSVSSQDRL